MQKGVSKITQLKFVTAYSLFLLTPVISKR